MATLPVFLQPRNSEWVNRVFDSESSVLQYMCAYGETSSLSSIKERCLEISANDEKNSWIMPTGQPFWNLIVFPMMQANRCYSLGHYLASLSVCGFVAERLAYVLCLLNNIKTEREDGEIRYRTVMNELNDGDPPILPEKYLRLFKEVRKLRNKYIHSPIFEDWDLVSSDAKICYSCINSLLDWVFQGHAKDGVWYFEYQPLAKFLEVNSRN